MSGKLLTVQETADRLGVSAGTVYQLCAAKAIRHKRIGLGRGVIRIAEADLDAYVASRQVEAERPPLKFIR